jgi:RNA polymerase sigma factor (sigma-70 family)
MAMDKETLKQYKSLRKEIPRKKQKLNKLYERLEDLEVVTGKVKASSKDFPYIETSVSVQMNNPKEADNIKKRIRLNEDDLKKAEATLLDIERFINGLNNSMDRQIIELVFLDGKKLHEVGKILGYTKGRISQKISNILKD